MASRPLLPSTQPQAASTQHPSAPTGAAPTSTPVYLTTPPDVSVPVPPAGFVPERLARYRGYFPKGEQTFALQDAITDLESFSDYAQVLGAAAPPPGPLVDALKHEIKWGELRRAAEAFFIYTRTMEVVSWKSALQMLQNLDRAYQTVKAQAPLAVSNHEKLELLLDASRKIGQRGASTRMRNRAAKRAARGEKAE